MHRGVATNRRGCDLAHAAELNTLLPPRRHAQVMHFTAMLWIWRNADYVVAQSMREKRVHGICRGCYYIVHHHHHHQAPPPGVCRRDCAALTAHCRALAPSQASMITAERLASSAAAGPSSRCAPLAAAASGEQQRGGRGTGSRGAGGRGAGRSRPPQRRDRGDDGAREQQERRDGGGQAGRRGRGGARGGRSSGRQPFAPAGKATFFTSQSFKAAGASEEMVAALKGLGITRPSHIQV